jgi:hypothetical protein
VGHSKKVSGTAALALALAMSFAAFVPQIARANPSASWIYAGQCPPPPGSAAVKCVQWVLDEYASHPMPQDGCFGSLTEAGVMDLQRFFGLQDIDGVVGPETGDALHLIMFNNTDWGDFATWMTDCFPIVPTTK